MFLKHDARKFVSFASHQLTLWRRRRIIVLGALAALAITSVFSQFSRLRAQEADQATLAAAQTLTGPERLARGIDQYNRGLYEESLTELQQIDASTLNDRQQRQLNDYLARASHAADQRKAARAAFEQGEQALASDKPLEAAVHYRTVLNNRFADPGTTAKAQEQLAVAEAMMKQTGRTLKDLYEQAVADYKAGNLAQAKARFELLESGGYRPGLFQKSPRDYIRDIDRKLASAPAPPAVTEAAPVEPVPSATAPPAAPQPQAAATTAPSEVAAATPPAAPGAPAAAAGPVDAKTAYRLARQQYRQGDWASARKNFELARDLGYKPGLFEDSPSKYLARMDAAEARQAAAGKPSAPPATGAPSAQEAEAARRQAESQKLLEQAEAARAAWRLEEAMSLYSRALELDPNNNAARVAKEQLEREMAGAPGRSDALARREQEILQQQQYITYSINTAISEANQAIAQKNFADAQAALERARVARASNPGVFRQEQLREFDQRIANTQTALDSAAEAWRREEAARQRQQAAEQLKEAQRIREEEVRRTVADLIRESRRLTAEGRYDQALGVLDQILKLDPKNDYALGVRPLVEDRAILQQQRQYREQQDRDTSRQYVAAEEKKIPYSDILTFPSNWPDLVTKREQTIRIERRERDENAPVIDALDKILPEVRLNDVSFSDALDFLRDVGWPNIEPNWPALEAAGVDRNAPINARLKNVTFRAALEEVLSDAGGTVRLGYTIRSGVIRIIVSAEAEESDVVTVVYDIRDLIFNVPDSAPQALTLPTGGGGTVTQTIGALEDLGQTRIEIMDQFVETIQAAIPAVWDPPIRPIYATGQMIVTQRPEIHRQIEKLLAQIRWSRAIQITVEARFLMVSRSFLEQVGFDFDMILNPTGEMSSKISPIAIGNASSDFTATIGGDLQGSSPTFTVTNGSGGAVTFLDDFQVSVLLRASQLSQSTTTLTAPRITLFSGQIGWVNLATQVYYISDLTPVVAANAIGFDPTIGGPAQDGVLLWVRATASHDLKYVTLQLRPTLTRLRRLREFTITAQATPTDAPPTLATGIIQTPEYDVAELQTTVSVPDGGTVLLGGQTIAAEYEKEAGVPVLSKVPFLKRLFTNTASAKDERVLLILVKPTIIVQREREQEQFPLVGTKVGVRE